MTSYRPRHECQEELNGFLPNLARVPHSSHYMIDYFSIQLNSPALCCPLAGHHTEILALRGNEKSSVVVCSNQ